MKAKIKGERQIERIKKKRKETAMEKEWNESENENERKTPIQ